MAAAGNRPSLQGNASTVFLEYRVILGCAMIPSIHSRGQGVGLGVQRVPTEISNLRRSLLACRNDGP